MKKSMYELKQSDKDKGNSALHWLGSVVVTGAIVMLIGGAIYYGVGLVPGQNLLIPTQPIVTVTPTPEATKGKSPVAERLQLIVNRTRVVDGRLEIALTADNTSPDAKSLPLANFLAQDEKNLPYQADPSLSNWVEAVPANHTISGWITLNKPLVSATNQIRVGFTRVPKQEDVFAEKIVTVDSPSPIAIEALYDLATEQPFTLDANGGLLYLGLGRTAIVNGMMLAVAKVENINDTIFRFYIFAAQVGTIRISVASGVDPQQYTTAWKKLEKREFFARDQDGNIYRAAPESDWFEGLAADRMKGSITLATPLRKEACFVDIGFYDDLNATSLPVYHLPIPWSDDHCGTRKAQSAEATPTAAPGQKVAEAVANDTINLRSGPDTNYNLVGSVGKGAQLPITGKSPNGEWWQVNYNGEAGWIFAQLVTAQNTESVPVIQNIPGPPN